MAPARSLAVSFGLHAACLALLSVRLLGQGPVPPGPPMEIEIATPPKPAKPAPAPASPQPLPAKARGKAPKRTKDRPRDPKDALARTRRAAEPGDAGAQASIGGSYVLGYGVVRDDAAAASWYRKAAVQGNAAAQKALREMEKPQDKAPGAAAKAAGA